MYGKDESTTKQQQDRLNAQLSSLFDSDDTEEDFEEGFEDAKKHSKRSPKQSHRKLLSKHHKHDYDDEDDNEDDDVFSSTSTNSSGQRSRRASRPNKTRYPKETSRQTRSNDFEDSELDDIFGSSSEQSPKKEKRKRREKPAKKRESSKGSSKKSKKQSKKSSKQTPRAFSSLFKRNKDEEYFEDDSNFLDNSRITDLYDEDSEGEYGDIGYPEDYEVFDPSENAKERQKSRLARKKKRTAGPDNRVYYDRDGRIIENEDDSDDRPAWTRARIAKWIIIAVVVSMVALLGWGGYNTDFDENGKAYVVPLELLPERAYIRKADKLLNVILSMDKTFDEDTYYLPTDYSNMYSKLTKVKKSLNESTNELSRYVNVPEDYQGYHTNLINFSLSIQDCINNLIKNREATDYEDYREEVFAEYLQDLNSIKKQRKEIETELFRNISDDSE